MTLPNVVSLEDWRAASAEMLAKEKALTRAQDALAAERRRLPVTRVDTPYFFEGPDGRKSLLDLFDGRSQLIVYHFMFAPDWDAGCDGCSMFADSVGHLAHLHARDTSLVMVSLAPLAKLQAYRTRMGWDIPWVSSFGTDFNRDFDATDAQGEEHHALSVLLRDGDTVYRGWSTANRGVEQFLTSFNFLDVTPYGRQEDWEDSPEGWPQTAPYDWWRRHDEYGQEAATGTPESAD